MYKLSPSDFAYLYEDCKHCYYHKVKYGLTQPSMPMPGIFSAINTRLQGMLLNHDLRTLSPILPEGKVISQEGFVESIPIPNTQVYLKGKYDLLVEKRDGSHLLIDFKLSQPHEDKIEKYKTQLFSYKYALEHPRYNKPISISQLGLIIMYPDTVHFIDGKAKLDFPPKWLDVPVDEGAFFKFIYEVNALLAGSVPHPSQECKWCTYRANAAKYMMPSRHDLPF